MQVKSCSVRRGGAQGHALIGTNDHSYLGHRYNPYTGSSLRKSAECMYHLGVNHRLN